ncbi:hypothetical protein F7734_38600 [Scytonema sp. UIC 10036]|uniref:hypothetical protein n=1 Tax=Scytonema sp. UIC 10036 TaxID=2304196 RepID=UPI0012DAED35|nr:hypothetical protein [Scytonema sp. UIC 10036]MUG97907.1 hypothetical protein [Scytonema sp. UIC 10036]
MEAPRFIYGKPEIDSLFKSPTIKYEDSLVTGHSGQRSLFIRHWLLFAVKERLYK